MVILKNHKNYFSYRSCALGTLELNALIGIDAITLHEKKTSVMVFRDRRMAAPCQPSCLQQGGEAGSQQSGNLEAAHLGPSDC